MGTRRTLAERLTNHPDLEQRFSETLNVVEAESSRLGRTDDVEDAVVANLQKLGNKILTDWVITKELQKDL